MISRWTIKSLKDTVFLSFLCVSLCLTARAMDSPGRVREIRDLRQYRIPSKQDELLQVLGLSRIELKTEPKEEVDRSISTEVEQRACWGRKDELRRMIYLPFNTDELIIGLDILMTQARCTDLEGPPFLAFVRRVEKENCKNYPAHGYNAELGILVAEGSPNTSTKRSLNKRIEINLKGLMEAFPDCVSVLPTSDWQTPWKGSVGLAFNTLRGPLHVYFATCYSGFAPMASDRTSAISLVGRSGDVPEIAGGYKLYSVSMLHALTHAHAPKFDAMWIFYDSGLDVRLKYNEYTNASHGGPLTRAHRSTDDSFVLCHSSHLRSSNQSHDYAHHQTLRLLDHHSHTNAEERKEFYDKMWAHMKRFSNPNLLDQLHALEKEDIPFIRALEKEIEMDEKLLPEHPFTFRTLVLCQAYCNFSLPMKCGDWDNLTVEEPETSSSYIKENRDPGFITKGIICVRGGVDLPVPDSLWDGRFKLFPRNQAHMINVGGLSCNQGFSPFSRSYDDRFCDGLHCGFAKKENIWHLGGGSLKHGEKSIVPLEEVAKLIKSLWTSNEGRFWYEHKQIEPYTPIQQEVSSSLSLSGGDRKPTVKTTDPPLFLKAAPFVGKAISCNCSLNASWWHSGTAIATMGTAVGMGYYSSKALVRDSDSPPRDKMTNTLPRNLKFIFKSYYDTGELYVNFGVEGGTPILLHRKQEGNDGGKSTQYRIYLYAILENELGEIMVQKAHEIALNAAGTMLGAYGWTDVKHGMKEMGKKAKKVQEEHRGWFSGWRGKKTGLALVGFLFIGDTTPVKETFAQWQQAGTPYYTQDIATLNPLCKLEMTLVDKLNEVAPGSIVKGDWYSFECAKQRSGTWLATQMQHPIMRHIQIRMVTFRGLSLSNILRNPQKNIQFDHDIESDWEPLG